MSKNLKNKLSLKETHPQIAAECHPTKNEKKPEDYTHGSPEYIWFICPNNSSHEYNARISHRTKGSRCPFCYGHKISKERSLAYKYPEIAKEFHPTKNGNVTPDNIFASSSSIYIWLCFVCNYEWEASVDNRTKGTGCPGCANKVLTPYNSLAKKYPKLLQEWDYEKNKNIDPDKIIAGGHIKRYWTCKKGHSYEASIIKKIKEKTGCPYCSGNKVIPEKSVLVANHKLAKEWDYEKNGDLRPENVSVGSPRKVGFKCLKCNYRWEAAIYNRNRDTDQGCPMCRPVWTLDKIRIFIISIIPYIDTFNPAELYVLLQQNGLLNVQGKTGNFIQHFQKGKFSKQELEKFVNNESSIIDLYINNGAESVIDENTEIINIENQIHETFENTLPIIETKDVLAALDTQIIANSDAEAIEFFIKSALAKIWNHAFRNEIIALDQLEKYQGNGSFAKEVKQLWVNQYESAKNLIIPVGYNFFKEPNLMQRYVASLIQAQKCIANWSGTGAGKTLSAVLASRVINAKITVICSPNNVIDTWKNHIINIYPDSVIYIKKIPNNMLLSVNTHHYILLHYEFFQNDNTMLELDKFIIKNQIDFVVLDEIHYAKQRSTQKESKRKNHISAFLSKVRFNNSSLCVLGMSATPVINDLFEGKTIIEMVTGLSHDELQLQPTVSNCISLYKKFVTHGIRYIPEYTQQMNESIVDVDSTYLLEDIRKHKTYAELEAILMKAKLDDLLKNLETKTIVYTHYRDGIDLMLQNAISNAGWKVGFFNGTDKTGLEDFKENKIDVLIATSCIGTGIDGLQKVCNRLIIACLPWTYAEYQQLVGRLYRQGQMQSHVDVIVLLTYALVNGKHWSWCKSRWNRIKFKKTVADAAVDGIIPDEHMKTKAQAHKEAMAWFHRLEKGETHEIIRQSLSTKFNHDLSVQSSRTINDFGVLNQKINSVNSDISHKRFLQNPEDWYNYHAKYREVRKEWEIIPYQQAIEWLRERPHWVIADFGCGEALIAQALSNQIYSFDYIAINDQVIACDMKNVDLESNILDAAIFSLSLMGLNFIDYLKEAQRCLKLDGYLWIAEPIKRINNINTFKDILYKLGFDVVGNEEYKAQFVFIKSIKTGRKINEIALKELTSNNISS